MENKKTGATGVCRTAMVWAVSAAVFVIPLAIHFETTEGTILVKVVVGQTFILAITAAWLLYRALSGDRSVGVPSVIVPAAFLVLVYLASFPFSGDDYEGYIKLTQLVCHTLFVFVLADIARISKHREYIVMSLVCAGLAASVYGIAQSLGYDFVEWTDKTLQMSTTASTFGNRNFAAHFLVVSGFLCTGYAITAVTAGRRTVFAVSLLIMLVHLVLTETRAAYLGTAAALGIVGVWTVGEVNRRADSDTQIVSRNTIRRVAAGGGAAACIGAVFARGIIWKTILSFVRPYQGSNLARFLTWRSTSAMIADHPFTGVGLGDYAAELPLYMTSPHRYALATRSVTTVKAHNEYLETFAETGIAGLLALLFLFAVAVFVSVRLLKRVSDGRERVRIVFTLSAVVASGVMAMFTFNLQNPASSLIFWLCLGLLAAHEFNAVAAEQPAGPKKLSLFRLALAAIIACALVSVIPERWCILRADVAHNRSKALRDAGKHTAAVEELDVALSGRYTPAETYFTAGSVHLLAKNTQDSINMYRECLARQPNHAIALMNMGFPLLAMGDIAGADKTFSRATELAPALANAWYGRAVCATRTSDWQLAYSRLREAARLGESGKEYKHTLALVLLGLGKPEEAEPVLRKLIKDHPKWTQAREDYAQVLFTIRDFNESYKEATRVLDDDSRRAKSHRLAALSLLAVGRDLDVAARHAVWFVKLDGDRSRADQMLDGLTTTADKTSMPPHRQDAMRYYLGSAFYALGSPVPAAVQFAKVGPDLPPLLRPEFENLADETFRRTGRDKDLERLTELRKQFDADQIGGSTP